VGVNFVEKIEDQNKEAGVMVGEGSSNITTKLKCIILLFPFIVSQIHYTA